MIYLIDADKTTAKALERLLVAEGMEVSVVADGVDFVRKDCPGDDDVIVLDIDSSDLDAEELAGRLRAKHLRTPVIVLSDRLQSDAGKASFDLARRAGAVGFFSKPIDGYALADAIRFSRA